MLETTFQDSSVIHELTSDYINLKINVARNTTFAKDFEIHVFPTLMVIDKWGNALIRDTGYKSPKQLLNTIHKTRSKSRYLLESIDSILNQANPQTILSAIDSVKYYRDDYTAKNLAKKYLDTHKKEWGDPATLVLLKDYFSLDKKYLKFVSRNHKVFFAKFDSLRLKENIAFHVFLNSLKKDYRGRPVFEFKPLEPGFGQTIGNALRRVLLSSLEGFAITSVRIESVDHEFSTIWRNIKKFQLANNSVNCCFFTWTNANTRICSRSDTCSSSICDNRCR